MKSTSLSSKKGSHFKKGSHSKTGVRVPRRVQIPQRVQATSTNLIYTCPDRFRFGAGISPEFVRLRGWDGGGGEVEDDAAG